LKKSPSERRGEMGGDASSSPSRKNYTGYLRGKGDRSMREAKFGKGLLKENQAAYDDVCETIFKGWQKLKHQT